MDELKAAYRRLGLPEDITKEELDKRFDLLLKRSRSKGTETDNGYEEDFRAFRYILDARQRQEIEEATRSRLAKWGKLAGPIEKTEDFFRLYKVHTLVSLLVLVAVVAGSIAFANHREEQKRLASLPPLDLSIVVIGNYQVKDERGNVDALNAAILSAFPEWKRVETKLTYLPQSSGSDGPTDMALLQKAVAELSIDSPDLYLMDDWTFEWLGKQSVLDNLDAQAAGNLKDLLKDGAAKKEQTEDDTEAHVYGIDVSDSTVSKSLPLYYKDLIAGVRANSTRKDKAAEFIERFLTENQ